MGTGVVTMRGGAWRARRLLAPAAVIAAAWLAACLPAAAREVTIVFAYSLPPYVMRDSSHPEGSGFEFEIFRAALAARGYTMKPAFAELGRLGLALQQGLADGAQRGGPDLPASAGYHYAAGPTVSYEDVAITLRRSGIAMHDPADLRSRRVAAFQGAKSYLGPAYAAAVAGNPDYLETADEKRKIALLFDARIDVYVGDINIFRYYRGLASSADTSQEVVIHRIFPARPDPTGHAVFRDARLRDDFDAGLQEIRRNGTYARIVGKYRK